MSPKWYDFAAQKSKPGEELLKNYSGKLDGDYGHLFLTNQRLLFVKEEGFLRKSYEQTLDLPYTNLDELKKEGTYELCITCKDGKEHKFMSEISTTAIKKSFDDLMLTA